MSEHAEQADQTYAEEIGEALGAAEEAIEYIEVLLEHREDLLATEAMRVLRDTRLLIDALKGIDSDLVRLIYDTGEYGEQVIEGIGLVHVSRGAKRTQWHHDDWRAAVRKACVTAYGSSGTVADVETGETFNVYDLIAAAQDAQGAGAPKTTVLRKLGIDPDDYCHSEPGNPQVTFRS
jgi:hypothetical protein